MPLVVANGGVLSRFGIGGESSQALFGILPAGTGESIDPTEPLNLSAELVTLTPVELAFEEPSTSQSPVLEEMWNPPAPPPPLPYIYPSTTTSPCEEARRLRNVRAPISPGLPETFTAIEPSLNQPQDQDPLSPATHLRTITASSKQATHQGLACPTKGPPPPSSATPPPTTSTHHGTIKASTNHRTSIPSGNPPQDHHR
ncbi:unnamed protein product [Boreogadus saida]